MPSSGPVLAFILNVMSDLYSDNEAIYWQRVIESFKHAYGQRSNLGDYENDPEYGESIKMQLEKLLGTDLVKTVRSLIKDDKTSQDYMYHGANFTVEPDHGIGSYECVGQQWRRHIHNQHYKHLVSVKHSYLF